MPDIQMASGNLPARKEISMTDPAIENYEALDASAHIGDRGATATITLLTRRGPIVILMKRTTMEQLYHRIQRELNDNPIPSADTDREIS
jgi:uncharacterized NAD(P)/FAD-binding protein YdhS